MSHSKEVVTREGTGLEFANSVALSPDDRWWDSDVCQVSLLVTHTHSHSWGRQHGWERLWLISGGIDHSLSQGCEHPCFFWCVVSPACVLTRSAGGRVSRSPRREQSGLLGSLPSFPPSIPPPQPHPDPLRFLDWCWAHCAALMCPAELVTSPAALSLHHTSRPGGGSSPPSGEGRALSCNSCENASQELHGCSAEMRLSRRTLDRIHLLRGTGGRIRGEVMHCACSCTWTQNWLSCWWRHLQLFHWKNSWSHMHNVFWW